MCEGCGGADRSFLHVSFTLHIGEGGSGEIPFLHVFYIT